MHLYFKHCVFNTLLLTQISRVIGWCLVFLLGEYTSLVWPSFHVSVSLSLSVYAWVPSTCHFLCVFIGKFCGQPLPLNCYWSGGRMDADCVIWKVVSVRALRPSLKIWVLLFALPFTTFMTLGSSFNLIASLFLLANWTSLFPFYFIRNWWGLMR